MSPHTLSDLNKALVCFYRPLGESLGYDRTYFLAVNHRKVVDLLHGGYFPYETSPGRLILLSDVNRTVRTMIPLVGAAIEAATNPQAAKMDIDVEAGKTYYVKMHPKTSFTHFTPRLSVVTREIGEREIAGCRLITDKP